MRTLHDGFDRPDARVPLAPARWFFLALLIAGLAGCGKSSAPSKAVAQELQTRFQSPAGVTGVRGERLIQPKVTARFYDARKYLPAWPTEEARDGIVKAIREVERDGLTPADYHLSAIEALRKEREGQVPARDADLDLLLTDAVAAITDQVQYGRVRPVELDKRWNVNPREGAPPLEEMLAKIAAASSTSDALEEARPRHFIYRGLVEALARLREIESAGGWRSIAPGKPIQPGAIDSRIPSVRARLAATSELEGEAGSDSSRYDDRLRKAVELFKARHRLDATGVIDKNTVDAMNVGVGYRIAQVRANLERARWVLGGLHEDFMLVNLPAYKAYLIRDGKNVWETRAQIGKEARQTPTFRADMRTVVFNPDWTVPPTILAEDVLDDMRKGENALAKKGLTILDADNHEVDPRSIDWRRASPENFPYTLRQPPGDGNALGKVKFLFPNPYSIYLHDTPHRELFAAGARTFSSGCIRIENPMQLAEILLSGQDGWDPEKIRKVVDAGRTENVALEHPIPVLIVYWTVSVGASGEVRYMRDVYGLDAPLLAALDSSVRGGTK